MKPQEILSMIEEAAGTSLYESKKQSALKTIEKKDNKLTDINKILDEELNPTLGKGNEVMTKRARRRSSIHSCPKLALSIL